MGASQQVISSYGGADAPFSPADIAGLLAWYKADAIEGLVNNDPVVIWPDLSGNGYDATPGSAGAPTYQTNVVNGLPVVRFNGGQDLVSTYPTNTKPFTMFAVVRPTNFDDYRSIVGSAGLGGVHWRCNITTGLQNLDKSSTANIGTSSSAPGAGLWSIPACSYSGSGAFAFYLDGVADGSGTNDQTFSADTAIIGDAVTDSQRWLGDMAEIICYDSVLSGADLGDVVGYLQDKYGL